MSANINKNILQAKTNTDIVSIVSKYVLLNESRNILKGNCPFHQDSGNSLMVSPIKNIFKCFGCGKEGGPYEFITLIES